MSESERYVEVARVGDIPEGGVKLVRIDDSPVAVFHVAGEYHAIDDLCTHDGGPLAEGHRDGMVIECPRHGARFDIRTGAALCLPAAAAVGTYPVRVRDGWVEVRWT